MRRLSSLVVGGVLAALAASPAGSSEGSHSNSRSLTLYSVATAEQFVNNKDDRVRGQGANPLGNFKDASATTKQAKGPFPGDEAYFEFVVYSNPSLKARVGSAAYTCHYNFNRNAFCDATYELDGGTLSGSGAFSFDASAFTIAITGGTGKYRGARGDLRASPAAKHAQRLLFTLS